MGALQVVVNQKLGVITSNFEDIKKAATDKAAEYKGIVVTKDTTKDAKSDIAELRRYQKDINERKKEVKESYMQPYDEFEKQCKEVVGILEVPIDLMDKQVKEFEQKLRDERKTSIKDYFDNKIGDIDFISFEDVFVVTWISNMSTTMKSIKAEIDGRINTVKQDLDAIKTFGSEVEEKALSAYKESKKLADAVKIINDYEKQKAAILAQEEARRKAEEERKREEEIRRKQEEDRRAREAEIVRMREEERKKREEIERIRADERAKVQKELAEKQAKEQAEREKQERIERERAAALAKERAVKEPEPLPFETDDTLPFATEPVQDKEPKQEETAKDALPFDQEEPQSIAPAQQEELQTFNITIVATATNSQINNLRENFKAQNIKYKMQIMP